MSKSLWKCDDGSYDVVEQNDQGESCVTHQNVPAAVLAEAPGMLEALRMMRDGREREGRMRADAILARLTSLTSSCQSGIMPFPSLRSHPT